MENGGAVAEDETDDGADVNGARDREREIGSSASFTQGEFNVDERTKQRNSARLKGSE